MITMYAKKTSRNFLGIALASLTFVLSPLASALDYCVDTSAELQSAILAAANSAVSDEIRLETGTYTLGEVNEVVAGALTIRGGYPANCSGFGASSTRSSINHTGGNGFDLAARNNISLDRLVFSGFSRVQLDDDNSSFDGILRVTRTRFFNSVRGLVIRTKRADVWVENVVISGHSTDGLLIRTNVNGIAGRDVRVQFVTIAAPVGATSTTAGLLLDGRNAPFRDLLVYNTVLSGNPLDLRIFGQQALVQSSFWNTQDFQMSGGLDPGSNNNLSGDPGIASVSPFRPIQPSSQLINNGENPLGGSPTFDYDGDPRVVGSDPDIGAIESTVDDSATLVVTNTNDSGSGSLRDAISTGNTNPGFKKITFNIPGSCPRTIALQTPLPALTQDVSIVGYTQPGSAQNESPVVFDGTVCVFLTGANTLNTGLHLQTGNVNAQMSLSGLGFYGFSSEAVKISGPGRGTVTGSLFGTGLPLIGSVFANSVIRVQDAPRSRIGGLAAAEKNVLPMGGQAGINLEASSNGARLVYNNFIGINRAGTGLLNNGSSPRGVGVLVTGSPRDDLRGNFIGGSESHGIVLAGGATPAQQTRVIFNSIGIAPDGSDVGNSSNAVRILGGEQHYLFRNTLHNNDGDALAVVTPARRAELVRNTFFGNTGLAIDLSPDGVNPIDLDVGQTGANDQQNYPEILSARGSSVQGEIRYRLQSANGTYRIQFFANLGCFPSSSGFTQARYFLAETTLNLTCATATTNCSVASSLLVNNSEQFIDNLINKGITAIAIDEEGNTSELTPACELYVQGDNLFKDGFE
jgi:Periplasmic copper-binding protein (NosD)